mmetsp:Transcript_37707/g.108439  ORF Transcript_37707/g.108439 Transcript_37707/m.108439 type:complete len:577 (-) Transcript_37707:154-1884(-)
MPRPGVAQCRESYGLLRDDESEPEISETPPLREGCHHVCAPRVIFLSAAAISALAWHRLTLSSSREEVTAAFRARAAKAFGDAEWLSGVSLADEACRDVVIGDPCYESVVWAKWHGVIADPAAYAPCTSSCSKTDFQAVLHRLRPKHCPSPCSRTSASLGMRPVTAATTAAATTAASTTASPSISPSLPPTVPSPTTATESGGSIASQGGGRGDGACKDAVEDDACSQGINWARRTGIWKHPEWYPDLLVDSSFEAFQAELHKLGHSDCPMPCKDADLSREHALRELHGPFGGRKTMEFYVYRAQSSESYPLENVNVADLPGVMWYLHNEVVPSRAIDMRKYNITRILRYKVTMRTTWEFFHVHKRQFSAFSAFDNGKCTVPDCESIWQHYGFVVGCQFQQAETAAYFASRRTHIDGDCKPPSCNASIWYSLPGPCPGEPFTNKSSECMRLQTGGRCPHATGARDCTYSYEHAGQIDLDELVGIGDYSTFKRAGNQEYIGQIDGGIGSDFWNGKHDMQKCQARIDRVKRMFADKYPELPGCDALEEPPCDFDGFYADEFSWPIPRRSVVMAGVVKK